MICALDPGKYKTGVAVLDEQAKILFKTVVKTSKLTAEVLKLSKQYAFAKIVVGAGTASLPTVQKLESQFKIEFIDEKFSTLEARRRYWKENPPQGFLKLIPRGLRLPPGFYDDWAAVILAERYLKKIKEAR